MKYVLSLLLLVGVLLGAAAPAEAQRGRKRDEVEEKIKLYRNTLIAEELGLDEATATKLFAATDPYTDKMRVIKKDQRKLRTALETEAAKGKPDDKKIEELLDQLTASEKEYNDLRIQAFEATKGILTPLQRVELLELLNDIDRRIREMIAAAKSPKAPR